MINWFNKGDFSDKGAFRKALKMDGWRLAGTARQRKLIRTKEIQARRKANKGK